MAACSQSDDADGRYATKMAVAAIDFGTTYSGYAFALSHDYEADPPKIHTYTNWVAGGKLISAKTPTILLLNKDQSFKAFGYDAEDQYGDLAADDQHADYYYFRRFKMKLYAEKQLKRTTEITDERGKKMNAIKVFSICINYLKDHFLEILKKRVTHLVESDVHWVITVPAIWNDGSKQFMREAAEMAGIDGAKLIIALEPEAASLFCMHLPVDKMSVSGLSLSQSISPFSRGTKYMVVDVGGGTVDITVHEVVSANKLKEVNHASGGAWGGTRVDAAYENFIAKVFGKDVYDRFLNECVEDVVELQREFETKKRSVKGDTSGRQTLRIPPSLVEMYDKMKRKPIEQAVKENREFAGKLVWAAGKLRADVGIMNDWFTESCNETIKHVKKLFQEPATNGTKTILLVGGFSESPLLQDAFRKTFTDKRLIIPEEAGLAVLKGAVLFGHDPLTITARVAKCSYGVRVYRDFDDNAHPRNKREIISGKEKCTDVFAVHVQKGQELVVGQPQTTQRYTPLDVDQISLIFDIYTSTELNPQYVTDASCTKLGQLEVDLPGHGKNRGVQVQMKFGGTELIVEGKDEAATDKNKVTEARFNFLM